MRREGTHDDSNPRGQHHPAGARPAVAGHPLRAPGHRGGGQLLNTSLTFSPACFRLPLAWSVSPSAWSCSSSVASPTVSLALPLSSSALLPILSSVPMLAPSFAEDGS